MTYPLTSFHFQVEWGGTRIGFSEVSGLETGIETIAYREGSSPSYTPLVMPGMQHYSNVVLKRGVMSADNEFFQWINSVQLNHIERRDVIISLLNENHDPAMSWKLRSAWPVKLNGPLLNAMTSDVAIERLEIAHEGLLISLP